MRIPDKLAKKIYSVSSLAGIGLLSTMVIPLIIFIFFHPYYDHSEEQIRPLGYDNKTIHQENIRLIEQPIFSAGKNLARISIQARLPKKTGVKLSLVGDNGKIVRSSAKPRVKDNQIIWEFAPVKDSSGRIYDLIINIANNADKNTKLTLIPNAQKNYDIKINEKNIDGQSLIFYTESKFSSPKEKIQTFYKRIIAYKPVFVQWLFFPALLIFLILSAVNYKTASLIIDNDKLE